MAVLKYPGSLIAFGALVAQGACYSPDLRDCTVQCSTSTDCGGGQICGSDSYCATPEVAGRCALIFADAGIRDGAADAPAPRDAPLPIDATIDAYVHPYLRVKIIGKGSVEVVGLGTCDTESASGGDCNYDIDLGVALELRARPRDDYTFESWTSTLCSGQPDTCTITPTQVANEVIARFRKD